MADQTVRLEDSSGTPAAVAYRIWIALRGKHGVPNSMQADINLYSECLEAAWRGKAKVDQLT